MHSLLMADLIRAERADLIRRLRRDRYDAHDPATHPRRRRQTR